MGEDGLVSDRHIAYYRERALGGAGMIVVEPMPVHRTAVLTRGNFRVDDDSVIPGFRRLTRCVSGCRRRRHRHDPPAVPRRSARRCRQLVRAELVTVGPALVSRRRRQPRDDGGRDPRAHRRVRPRRRASPSVGVRWCRAVRRLPRRHRPVLDAVVEPPNRSLGRLAREPGAVLGDAARARSARRSATTSSSVWRSTSTPSRIRRCRWNRCRRSSPGTTPGR